MSYCTANTTVNPLSKVPVRTNLQDLIVPQEFIVFYPLAAGGILLSQKLQNIVISVMVKPVLAMKYSPMNLAMSDREFVKRVF